jgi:lipopolysaccharide transport system ATP-binding protein
MGHISAEKLVVDFPVFGANSRSLKKTVIRAATGASLSADSRDHVVVRAIDEMSFRIISGERVGLYGHNGSGKTTLLRVLVGAYEPQSGELDVQGKVASMLSISLGMDSEFTGLENIFLRGTVMGLRRREIAPLVNEIIEFAGLGSYIHMPMRTYSSGMAMRLAFAISTSFRADIVLMDEWLSVGDAEFAEKAEERLKSFLGGAKIMIVASHDPGLLIRSCTRVFHLDRGRIASDQPVEAFEEWHLSHTKAMENHTHEPIDQK